MDKEQLKEILQGCIVNDVEFGCNEVILRLAGNKQVVFTSDIRDYDRDILTVDLYETRVEYKGSVDFD